MPCVADADHGLAARCLDAGPVSCFLLLDIQELRGTAGRGLGDELSARQEDQARVLGGGIRGGGVSDDGIKRRLQAGVLNVQRPAGMSTAPKVWTMMFLMSSASVALIWAAS